MITIEKIFSLVVATVGRKKEVEEFLESVKKSDFSLEKIEVIIVDQNKKINLEDIIKKYQNFFLINHIKSERKGLSYAKNIGIKNSHGMFIAFPDDDCKYFRTTLKNVLDYFEINKDVDAVACKIIDENGENCIKNWGIHSEKVLERNFYKYATAIIVFKKNNKNIFFDEEFGLGEKYHGAEDIDSFYRMVKAGNKINYDPSIVIFHPKPTVSFTKEKAYLYGIGFGAFCRKNLDVNIFRIFSMSIGLVIFRITKNLLFFKFENAKISWNSLKGRMNGFLEYRK